MRSRLLDMQDEINPDSADRLYHVFDIDPQHDTLDDVIVHVAGNSADWLTFRVPNNFGIVPKTVSTRIFRKKIKPAWLTHKEATALVNYGSLDAIPWDDKDKEEDELYGPELSFDTMGGSTKILQSIGTIWRAKANEGINSAPDMRGVIGYSDGKVEGCEINTSTFKWSITYKGVPVTIEYLKKLEAMCATVNLDGSDGTPHFSHREPYSQLFLGATGNYRNGEGWVVTYNFLGGKNRLEVYVPKTGANRVYFPDVRAFDYLWFVYKEVTEAGFKFQVPKAGYQEQVYEGSHFRSLFQ